MGSRKVTVKTLQKLCGHLNFLCRCIVPGCAFTRRLYSFFNYRMKQHHHITVNSEMKWDLGMWQTFLRDPSTYCRPFADFSIETNAQELSWFMDSSGVIGFGGICKANWFSGTWSPELLSLDPSIEFLELYALTVSVLNYLHMFHNQRICLFCDNQSVVAMVNNSSSSCKFCMRLIRIITLESLVCNTRIFCKFIPTKENGLADALSRGQMTRFWKLMALERRTVNKQPDSIPVQLLNPHTWWN